MINKKIDLTAGVWWAVLLLLTVLITDNFVIRLILSLPLICFLTGHTVLRAIEPVQTARRLEHSAFAAGLSIAVCVGGGFLLNMISMLNPIGWAIWLMVVNGFAVVIALRQPYKPFVLPELPRIRVWHGLVLCAAISITSGSYVLAAYTIDTFHEFKYTEFWLIPEISGKIVIGVQSAQFEPEEYDIEVIAVGSTDKAPSGRANTTMIAAFRSIDLAPGAQWIREITVGVNHKRVEANLYRTRDHTLYRKVSALTPGPAKL
jgi:uncharacterized membrane protein